MSLAFAIVGSILLSYALHIDGQAGPVPSSSVNVNATLPAIASAFRGQGDTACQGQPGLKDVSGHYRLCMRGLGNGGCPGSHTCHVAPNVPLGFCCQGPIATAVADAATICKGKPAMSSLYPNGVLFGLCQPAYGARACPPHHECVSNNDAGFGHCCALPGAPVQFNIAEFVVRGDTACGGHPALKDNAPMGGLYRLCMTGVGNGGCPGSRFCNSMPNEPYGFCCLVSPARNVTDPTTICNGTPAVGAVRDNAVIFNMCKPSYNPRACPPNQVCIGNNDGDNGHCCPMGNGPQGPQQAGRK